MEGKYKLHGKFKETNQISFNVGIGGLIWGWISSKKEWMMEINESLQGENKDLRRGRI